MSESSFYSLTTKKKTLRCNHYDRLVMTQELYNQVMLFYYQLYLKTDGLRGMNSQQCLRELEKLTVVGRKKEPVPYQLPWKKLPLYFRRAAVNAAVCAGKSFQSAQGAGMAKKFQKAVTYYKGMYKDLTEEGIDLKVWNGQNWHFIHCRLSGSHLKDMGEMLSPSVVIRPEDCQLHIPVKESVEDGRKARERMAQGAGICCVTFANEDTLAVCAIFDRGGNRKEAVFIRGGSAYSHICREVLDNLERSRKACGERFSSFLEPEHEGNSLEESVEGGELPTVSDSASAGSEKGCQNANRKYWMKLKNVREYYSNSVSRQIINKCTDAGTEIIVLPKYDNKYTQYVMRIAGKWSPQYLSCRIREQLKYKAWREGILVLEVNSRGTGQLCSVCGSAIRKNGKQFSCSNGHQGNRFLNSAQNLHKRCLDGFDKQKADLEALLCL